MKRLIDIVFATLGLILLMPLLGLIALLIEGSSPGPLFFAQMRIGKEGKPFKCLKFRTMVANASSSGTSVTRFFDPRVIPICRVLRSLKFDELPQLWNVIRGEMSLVGPRPEVFEIVRFYTTEMMKVVSIRPGITSIVSIQLRNEEALLSIVEDVDEVYLRAVVPFKVAIGIEHVNRNSLFFDLKALARTVFDLSFGRYFVPKEEQWVSDLKTEILKLCARRREGIQETIEQSWRSLPLYIQSAIFRDEPPQDSRLSMSSLRNEPPIG